MFHCNSKVRFLWFLVESLFIGFMFYYVLHRDSWKGIGHMDRSSLKDIRPQRAGGTWSDPPEAKTEVIIMENCPEDWPLEVIRWTITDGTRQPTQVCRKKQGIGEWKCAPGWRAQVEDPYCVYAGIMEPPAGIFRGLDTMKSLQVFGQISDNLKLIFVHLPHTGGNVIVNSILFDDSEKKTRKNYFDDDRQISDLDQDQYKNYHKFSMVRHPCSKLISAWKYLTQSFTESGDKMWPTHYLDKNSMTSFDDFVMTTLSPGGPVDIGNKVHLRTQVSMLFDEKGRFRLNQLLVYERWRDSMIELGSSLHLDTSQLLSNYNSSEKEQLCKEMYTPSTWLKMTHIYTMDFCVLGYSRNMDEMFNYPPLNRSSESLSYRFTNCLKSIKEKLNSKKESPVEKLKNKKEPCVIYTYFQKQTNHTDDDTQQHNNMIDVWNTTWSQMGWTPRILSEDDAKKHPEYEQLYNKFFALPTVNKKEYEMACFLRHVAMAAVGGGWMSDYDLIPLRIPRCVKPLNGGRFTVYEHYTPSLVSGRADEFTRVSKMMANIDWTVHPNLRHKNRPHVSDMHSFGIFGRDGSVETMRVVIEASVLFTQPFLCNRTWVTNVNDLKPIPSNFPQLPWAIHFSHASLGFWRKENISSVWPGSRWNGMNLAKLRTKGVRPIVMREAFYYLQNNCNVFASDDVNLR